MTRRGVQGRARGRRRAPQYRPLGSPCLRDGCPREARPHGRHPHLAAAYCSDQCAGATWRSTSSDERTEVAEEIRHLLGMPFGRGAVFTLPELHELRRKTRALVAFKQSALPGGT